MNQLTTFAGNEIMILAKDDVNFDFMGDFIISAKAVATVLEYRGEKATSNVLKFCKDNHIYAVNNSNLLNRNVRKLHSTGEKFISNLSLNRVLGQSNQPKAEEFQDWLYEEVVPSVQKHGGYLTPDKVEEVLLNPDTIIQLATQLKQEREKRQELALTVEKQQPLVTFAETCMQSDKSIKIRELAHSISAKGTKIGQNRLFDKLRKWGLIAKKSTEPTQRAIEQGLFEVVTGVKQKPSGEPFTWRTPYVTVKGQVYIMDRLAKESA